MKSRYVWLALVFLTFLAFKVSAATLYVSLASTNSVPPYASWSTAAANIQDAVDASSAGDLVLVTNGVYQTGGRVVYGLMANRVALTKPVTVQSVNGSGVTVIEGFPVIGDSAVRCAYLTSGATLSGFTLTNGATRASGDFIHETYGAGVWCESTNSIISDCVISANHAQYYGGGAYSGTFNNCTLAQNNAGDGGGGAIGATLNNCILNTNSATSFAGGAYYSTLNNCTISGNSGYYGGGAEGCTLSNCVLSGNSASAGGGADGCTLLNCSISGNSASTGGGANNCTLANCTLIGNSATTGGGASGGVFNNCIVYFNNAPTGSNYSGATLNYCCTSPLPDSGTNNITLDPKLADGTHLAAESPCRGAGSSLFVTGADIDGDPWANPPSIGCDEYYSGSATGLMSVTFQTSYTNVPAGFVVSFVAQISGHATASRWEFGDGTVISNEPYCSHLWAMSGNYPVSLRAYNDDYPAGLTATTLVSVLDHPIQYVTLTSTNPVTPFLTWATAASNIQDAVDVGYINGTILVSNGVYSTGGRLILGSTTNRVAVTLPMTVQSVNGPGVTTIQGYQVPGTTNGNGAVSCVYLSGGANLVGFTLTKGASQGAGGGVWCSSTGSIVSNCILIGNSAYTGGGGAFRGTLVNCSIVGNSVTAPGHYPGAGPGGPSGGGASGSTLNNCILVDNLGFLGGGAAGGSLNDCMILSNSAAQGGGTYASILNNCTILNNSATNSGGGAYNGTLNNCIISNNVAQNDGGGVYGGTLNNCLLTGNSANFGGAVFSESRAVLNNCTIYGNSAPRGFGGGLANSGSAPSYFFVTNCIVFNNIALVGSNYLNVPSEFAFNHCCTFPLPSGIGNITNDPVFLDPIAGDSHLQSNSPCINSGNNAYVTATNDLDGNPRIVAGTVDIGAYEYQTPSSILSYAWAQQYGLPTDGTADSLDTDGDGMNNWQEWQAGTIPTDPTSLLKMGSPSNSVSGVTVTWQSVSGKIYFLQRSSDLSALSGFSTIQSNIAGQTGTTTYNDTGATGPGPFFYRVGVQ